PQVTTSRLPEGYAGEFYSHTLLAAGGKAPLTFSGFGPGDLTLSEEGDLSGQPRYDGLFDVGATVRDANGREHTVHFGLTIHAPPTLPDYQYIPNGRRNHPYSYTLQAQGGVPPYSWSSTCCLPRELTLSTAGVLSGTPTS